MVSAKVGTQRPGFSIRLSVIDGSADRFLYFNDDMMLVGPVESTDFFSNEGKVNLRGPRGRKQFLSKTGDPLNLL